MKSLSPQMRRAIALARENGGRLIVRRMGLSGALCWAGANTPSQFWITNRTIQALVERGFMEYPDTYLFYVGPPFQVTLTAKAEEA